MKRVFSIILCAAFCFGIFSACSKEQKDPDPTSDPQSAFVSTDTQGTDSETDRPTDSSGNSESNPASDPETDPESDPKTDPVTDPVSDPNASSGSSEPILPPDPPPATDRPITSEPPTEPDPPSTSTEEPKEPVAPPVVFDRSISHQIIVTDIKNYSLAVLDLNRAQELPELNAADCVVWEWDAQASSSKNKDRLKHGLDDAKLRYSAYYQKNVVIACSSSGWAGIIDYETKELLLDIRVTLSPHSIELLPNGDFVVACAGTDSTNGQRDGLLKYYTVSQGNVKESASSASKVPPAATYSMRGCHGACWNPDLNRLVIDGYDGIDVLEIQGYGTKTIHLEKDSSYSYQFPYTIYAHDLTPIPGEPHTYYMSADRVYTYNVMTRKLTPISNLFSVGNIKGLAPFSDDTVVSTVAGGAGNPSQTWSTKELRIYWYEAAGSSRSARSARVYFPDREFYKVHSFDTDYYR